MTCPSDLTAAALDLLLGGSCVGCARPGPTWCARCAQSLQLLPFRAYPSPPPEQLPVPFAVARYDGVVKAALVAHKEEGRLALAKPLGRALALSVFGVLASCRGARVSRVLLVPVPSAASSVRQRGHDPMLRVTRTCVGAARIAGVSADLLSALQLVRHVEDQAGLSATERLRNLAMAHSVRPAAARRVTGRAVIITDDIITTGATAVESARALSAAGAQVLGVAVVAATQRRAQPPVAARDSG